MLANITVTDDALTVELTDSRAISVPLQQKERT